MFDNFLKILEEDLVSEVGFGVGDGGFVVLVDVLSYKFSEGFFAVNDVIEDFVEFNVAEDDR